MAYSRTPAANATPVNLGTGSWRLTAVRVRQNLATAAELFLQIFNKNAPTVGTDTPRLVLSVPAGDATVNPRVQKYPMSGNKGGLHFGTALSYAVTTTPGGLTNPVAGQEPDVELWFEPGN
jgi:hypothetical protein